MTVNGYVTMGGTYDSEGYIYEGVYTILRRCI